MSMLGNTHNSKFLNMFPMEKTPLEEEENEMDNGKDEEDDDKGEVEMEEALNMNRKVQKITIRVVCEHNNMESRKASSTTSSSSCCSSWSCCCQADECGVDLRMAKKYNQRHKVCERHSKAPVVLVSSIRQRFCQQCSKFHELAQFDDTKRSCRERLAGHNKRRRKAHVVAELHSRSEQQPATRGHFQ